jgi:peroxiredoxin
MGMMLPSVPLRSTDGGVVDLAQCSGRTVVFAYPRTGRAEEPESPEWNAIPGARGCTPQTCGFRDLYADLRAHADAIFGLSTQTTAYQREAVGRLHLPFALLSDSGLVFTRTLRLPTFDFTPYESQNPVHLKRIALVLQDGRIAKVFYPVFPPDRNAADVLSWLERSRDSGR